MKKILRVAIASAAAVGTLAGVTVNAHAADVTLRTSQVNGGWFCEAKMPVAPLTEAMANVQKALATQARETAKALGGGEDDVKDNLATKENNNILDNEYLKLFSYSETQNLTKEDIQRRNGTDVTTMAGLSALIPSDGTKAVRKLAEDNKLPLAVAWGAVTLVSSTVKPSVGPDGFDKRIAAVAPTLKKDYLDAVYKLATTYADNSVDAYNSCSDQLNAKLNLGLVKVSRDNFIGAPVDKGIIPITSGSSIFKSFSM
ncbi:MAG: hypothetical protein Q3962_07400 [Corynebacterium sp.]|nr:hypothetical protein [Corynebacterium sp.]